MSIAILMTVQNEEKYLRECLDSICAQTFQDWELFVVDDHSQDTTREILSEYSNLDERIKWSVNCEKGIIPALQLALESSKGEFITRMDGDDVMPPKKLEVLKQLLDSAGPKTIATGKVRYFSSSPVSEGYLRYENWLNERCVKKDHWKWVYRECVIASPNWMCRRKDLLELGGFSVNKYPEDYDLVLNWYSNRFDVVSSAEITHYWREHSERISRNSKIYDQSSFFELKLSYVSKEFISQTFYVIGTGQKAQLCHKKLISMHRKVECFNEPNDHSSERHISKLPSNAGILLIGIYPDESERFELEQFISGKGYVIGQNAFYL